ncbi:MAG: FAD-dependent oxidoreductase [Actinobacteria bacterium]|nr:FAD-dependent oxidoreductase [Actinomycetota bacterium]
MPAAVARPIARLGTGVSDKIFLQLPKRFWDDGGYAIRGMKTSGGANPGGLPGFW